MPAPTAQALLQAGRFPEAHAAWRQLLAQDPLSVEARLGLARACSGAGDALAAQAWLSDACRIAPQRPEPVVLLAELLLGARQYAQALPLYRRLYHELAARDRATLLHYGYCLEQAGEIDTAIERYREAVLQEPGFVEAHIDLAGVLWRVGDFDGSLAHAQAAVHLAPRHPYAVRMLGAALLHLGRLDDAERQLRQALALQPDFVLAQVDLAFTLLLAGRLEEGWDWYARRWSDTARLARPPFYDPAHEWQGPRQSLAGRRIAVYAEQGAGDVIQFARYLPLLQQRGATVYAVVPPELVALVEHSYPGVQCLAPGRTLQADLHAALLDLPLRFGTTLQTVPAAVPYLQAPPERARAWRERLARWQDKVKVGLAWSGWQGQVNNRNRATPLSLLLPLLALPGVQGFSLQKGDAGTWTDAQPAPGQLVDFTGDWGDYADSAAMLQQLDLVITVDTSVAHLAGALGKEAWVLLPPNPDFRWLLGRDDSPWYPGMRLFRREFGPQGRARQAASVVQALRQRLAS